MPAAVVDSPLIWPRWPLGTVRPWTSLEAIEHRLRPSEKTASAASTAMPAARPRPTAAVSAIAPTATACTTAPATNTRERRRTRSTTGVSSAWGSIEPDSRMGTSSPVNPAGTPRVWKSQGSTVEAPTIWSPELCRALADTSRSPLPGRSRRTGSGRFSSPSGSRWTRASYIRRLAFTPGSLRCCAPSARRPILSDMTLTDVDRQHLRRCVDLAREALEDGDEPFGSVLVDAEGTVRFEDRNRVKDGDHTRHPELEIARWAARHLSPEERAAATVYTSGEHCPMCAAAHGWVGLGRIVYASSSEQLTQWHAEWGVAPGPVLPLPVESVAPGVPVAGPDPELSEEIRELQRRLHSRR